MRRQITGLILAGALTTSAGLVLAPAASAKDGDARYRAACDMGSRSDVKLRDKDGRIRVDFYVKNNQIGEAWNYTLTQNGTTVVTSTRSTRATDDSSDDDSRHTAEVKWKSYLTNAPGTDTIAARAVNAKTGEVCTFNGTR